MEYIRSIEIACLFFPFIAFLFTLPFVLYEYHKYGSINKFRTLIIYSFILYLMVIYFLVILPLPKIDDVVKFNIKPQLRPFDFVISFIKDTPLVINDPSTYFKALCDSSFYTIIFNILMFIPFGIYLRYYFKCSLGKTIFLSFLLSLFFELTQLTGLYFIYPKPYRLFDVDDLIINTFGGYLGYLMGGLFKFLPSRDEIDAKAIRDGKIVSGLRRIVLFFLDYILFLILGTILSLFKINNFIFSFLILYILVPLIFKGQTLGARYLKVKIDCLYGLLGLLFRNILVFGFYFDALPLIMKLLEFVFKILKFDLFFSILIKFSFLILFFILYIITVNSILHMKKNFYDKWLKIEYISLS